jgi:hypothetical protein
MLPQGPYPPPSGGPAWIPWTIVIVIAVCLAIRFAAGRRG